MDETPEVLPAQRGPNGRERILAAARELFPKHGYQATTLRAIASRAEVDVALISHHFGGKKQLYDEATSISVTPAELGVAITQVPLDELGFQLINVMVRLWDGPEGPFIVAQFKTLLIQAPDFLRDVIARNIWGEVRHRLASAGIDQVATRVTLAASVVTGLGLSRMVLGDPLVMALPRRVLVDIYGPILQSILTGKLPLLPGNDKHS